MGSSMKASLKRHLSGGGIVGAATSLSVTTIGAGVLAIPWTMQEGGIVLVALTLTLVAALTVLSIEYLILCVDCLSLRSYEEISRELLGRTFEEAVRWILITYNVGIAAGYIVVIGDIFTPMLPLLVPYLPFLSSASHVMIFFWTVIMLPLSCIPHITQLNHISFLGITATFLISGIIVYRYFVPYEPLAQTAHASPPVAASLPPESSTTRVKYFALSFQALLALPVVIFSYDCQSLVFQIYANLNRPIRSNMVKVATLSVTLTGLVYGSVGLFGYLSNKPFVKGNILTNYDPLHDTLFAVGEGVYSLTVVIAYVLVLFPSRDAVFIFLYGYNTATHELTQAAITKKQHICVSVMLAICSLLLALVAPGIIFIVTLLGGICSSTLCFSYPAAFRLALHMRGIERCTRIGLWAAIGMLVFGVASAILGTSVSILAS